MALELEGKVFQVLPEESGQSQAGKTWRKQSFVIETEETYPKKVCFTAWSDLVDGIKALKVGEKVKVSFRIESREFNNKWYTDVVAWKIAKIIVETVSNSGDLNNSVIYGNQTPQNNAVKELNDNFDNSTDLSNDSQSDDLPF
jgi:hypothetical protein